MKITNKESVAMIPANLPERMREHLVKREIRKGLSAARDAQGFLEMLDPKDPLGPRLLEEMATWIDMDFVYRTVVKNTLAAHYPRGGRAQLAYLDAIRLKFVDGLISMHDEDLEGAIVNLRSVLADRAEMNDKSWDILVLYMLSRSYRMQGRFEPALPYALEAKGMSKSLGHTEQEAVIDVLISWLLMQLGQPDSSGDRLDRAYTTLQATDDFDSLGNIASFKGRLARRARRLGEALTFFDQALVQYGKHHTQLPHPHEARVRANRAYVLRLRAQKKQAMLMRLRQLEQQDPLLAELQLLCGNAAGHIRKHHRELAEAFDQTAGEIRKRLTELNQRHGEIEAQLRRNRTDRNADQDEALDELRKASEIYHMHENHRGAGNCWVYRSYVEFDRGDFEEAKKSAHEGYNLGDQRSDHTLMARALIVKATVENARCWDVVPIDEDPGTLAEHAAALAERAKEKAREIKNHRLEAIALLQQVLAFGHPSIGKLGEAERMYREAEELQRERPNDYVTEQLLEVHKRVWADDRSATISIVGPSFHNIEGEIVRFHWGRTGTVSRFQKALQLKRNGAVGMLKRHGITPPKKV